MVIPARQRMLFELRLRNYSPHTERAYLYHVDALSRHYDTEPDGLCLGHIRTYLLHLINERQCSWSWWRQAVAALRFLYGTTLGREGYRPPFREIHRQLLPGVRIVPSPRYPGFYVRTVVLRGGAPGCGPALWIDGVQRTTDSGAPLHIDRYVDPFEVAGIEVYRSAAEVPSQYSGPYAGCGVLVIWTREGR